MQNCKPAYKNKICGLNRNIWWPAVVFFYVFIVNPGQIQAEDNDSFDEVPVSLYVQGIGATDIPALITQKDVFLPIINVFDFLRIKNTVTHGMDSISGFFINPGASFLIDRVHKIIFFQNKIYNLSPDDLVRTETNLYLRLNYFRDVFGLVCTFNFRSLSVTISTKIELPAIREMRLEQMHKNIRRLNGEMKADTIIGRNYPLFQLGTADWSFNGTQNVRQRTQDTKLNLSLGGLLAGGEAKASINSYSIGNIFTNQHLNYSWRFADNNNDILRQITTGKINPQSISTIYAPVIGAQITNTPTSFRRSFGHYTVSDHTEPGWIVELYMNNVLVDYVKADDSGFFTFNVPLIYGSTEIVLRFYGPWGEERSQKQNIFIPYNFLPPKEFEYTVTTGIAEDIKNGFFSRAIANYGISSFATIGGGIEYLSSLQSQKAMPFLKTSLSLGSGLLFTGEYTHGVKSNGILSYHTPSDLQLELSYTLYHKGQKAINTNSLEERKAVISMPLKFGETTIYSRLNVNQLVLPNINYTLTDLLFSGSFNGISANLLTNASFLSTSSAYIFSTLSLSSRMLESFTIRPQVQYDYNREKFSLIRCEFEKQFFQAINLNAAIENNFINNSFGFQIGVRYEFPFIQTGSNLYHSNSTTSFSQSMSGSLIYDSNTHYLKANNRTSVGKCGIVVLPFLDVNGNGVRELNEPKISGLNIHINGGQIEESEEDSTIRIYDLEPYTNYFIELANTSFDNIAWKVNQSTINVAVNPNQCKLIEVPITVRGEVSGTVYLKTNVKKGLGRVYVCIYNSNSALVGRVLSEEDGYFSFLGLKPGSYTARIDSKQLKNIQMTSLPDEIPFTIRPSSEGDVADGLDFVLEHIELSNTK